MTNRDQLLLGSIWNRKKEPECCPCPDISKDADNIIECRSDGLYATATEGGVTSAEQGLSDTGGVVTLGQDIGEAGNPAALTSNREIPLNGNNLAINGAGALKYTFEPFRLHITDTSQDAQISASAASFSNTAPAGTSLLGLLNTADYFQMVLSNSTGRASLEASTVMSVGTQTTDRVDIITNGLERISILGTNGNVGIRTTNPTAQLHLPAGATGAQNAPLKFTSGALMITPETGAVEFDGTHFYGTIGSTRFQLDQQFGSTSVSNGLTFLSGTARLGQASFASETAMITGMREIVTQNQSQGLEFRVTNNASWRTRITPNGLTLVGATTNGSASNISFSYDDSPFTLDIGYNSVWQGARFMSNKAMLFGQGIQIQPNSNNSAAAGAPGTYQLKFVSTPLLTTPENGAIEYDGTHFYGTFGGIRHQLDNAANAANNGVSIASNTIQLGQAVGASGNPASLLSSRQIPMNGFNINFTGGFGSQTQIDANGKIASSGFNLVGQSYGWTNSATCDINVINVTNLHNSNAAFAEFTIFNNRVAAGGNWAVFAYGSTLHDTLPDSGMVGVNGNAVGHFLVVSKSGNIIFSKEGTVTDILPFGGGPGGLALQHGRITNASNWILGNGSVAEIAGVKLLVDGQIRVTAGTATRAPLKLTAGVNLTTAETGAIEYNGTNIFFTRTGTTRETIFTGVSGATTPGTTAGGTVTNHYGGDTNFLGDPNSWASVVINGTTYKIPLYT